MENHRPTDLTVSATNHRITRVAQPGRALGDRIKHRLNIRRRAGDDAEDFACRRLLLQRLCQIAVAFLQFFEQPHVLDGNDGLVGEGFEKRDLLFRERPELGASDRDRADGDALTQQWSRQNVPS